jgi:hypothetical protein
MKNLHIFVYTHKHSATDKVSSLPFHVEVFISQRIRHTHNSGPLNERLALSTSCYIENTQLTQETNSNELSWNFCTGHREIF